MRTLFVSFVKIIFILNLLILPIYYFNPKPTSASACYCSIPAGSSTGTCVDGTTECIDSRDGVPCTTDYDCSILADVNCTACSVITFAFRIVIPWVFGLGILAAVVFLVIGGIRYVTAGDDPKKISDAKGTVTWSIIGLIILILAAAIIRLIWLFFGFESGKIFLVPTQTYDVPAGKEPVLDCTLCGLDIL